MIDRTAITRDFAYLSLLSRTCPACGRAKGERKSLCFAEFCALPRGVKAALYFPIGRGYEDALYDALVSLGAERLHPPTGGPNGTPLHTERA